MPNTTNFSHIYIEKGAEEYPDTERICRRFSKAQVIEVEDYKHIFNRSNQRFQAQKRSMKLILAVKKDHFLYPGSGYAPDFGHDAFYYSAQMFNCVYNCDYCYLQGMYASGNLVIFVNHEAYMTAADERLAAAGRLYLCVSYDTDLLAFENVLPLCRRWIEFARTRSNLLIEIRTKSANFDAIAELDPIPNVVLAWTLSPATVAGQYEGRTPPLAARLTAAREALEAGWPVRVCFDPVLRIENWQERYAELIDSTFAAIDPAGVFDCCIGAFRMNAEYLKRIRRQREDSDILYFPYTREGNTVSYSDDQEAEMLAFVGKRLATYLPAEKIIVHGSRSGDEL